MTPSWGDLKLSASAQALRRLLLLKFFGGKIREEISMKKFLAVVFVAALSASAFAADGAATFKSKCAGCHGPDGTRAIAAMGVKPINTPEVKKLGEAGVANIVTKGQGRMPAVGASLPADQVKAVASYVLTLK
jgi:mono/diheme cytochrome c family protein